MLYPFQRGRNLYAGAVCAILGIVVVEQGLNLRLGTLASMGPGFFPVVLGAFLVLLGAVIAATGSSASASGEEPVGIDVRGAIFILAGVVAFIALGEAFGFAAATFSCVFVSALGDREATLRSSAALAAGVTVCGGIVFTYFLSIPFQLYHWF